MEKKYHIYDKELSDYIRSELDWIEKEGDDGGGIAFAYQRILDVLHDNCSRVIDGKPSIVDEYGGI